MFAFQLVTRELRGWEGPWDTSALTCPRLCNGNNVWKVVRIGDNTCKIFHPSISNWYLLLFLGIINLMKQMFGEIGLDFRTSQLFST